MKGITFTKNKRLEDQFNFVSFVLDTLAAENNELYDFEGILNSLKNIPPEVNRESVTSADNATWRAHQFIEIVNDAQQWSIIIYKQHSDNIVEEFKFYSLSGVDFIMKWNAPDTTPIFDRVIKDKNGKILQKDKIAFLNQDAKYLVSEQEINGVKQPAKHKKIDAAYIMLIARQKLNNFKHEQNTRVF